MFEIIAREDFSDVTYLLEVEHPMLAKAARPGQFVVVISHERGERIPLTIADFDRDRGTITLVIQAVGKTTLEMQRTCKVGTSVYSLVGPMGVPTERSVNTLRQAGLPEAKALSSAGWMSFARSTRSPYPPSASTTFSYDTSPSSQPTSRPGP